MMRASLLPYAFIISSVVYLSVTLILARLTLQPVQFRLMIYTGALNATCGAFSYFLEDNYWTPARIGGLIIGIEDLLIAVAVGMIPWYLVALIWQKRMAIDLRWPIALKRIAVIMFSAYLTYLIGMLTDVDPMAMMLAVCASLTMVILALRPDSWPLAATGFIVFGLIWFLLVEITFAALPGFIQQWNLESRWGRPILGVPVGEIVWALIFGALIPLLTAFVFDVRVKRG